MLLLEVSDKLLAVSCDAVESLALETARQAIMDTVGVTLAGAQTAAGNAVRAAFAETVAPGNATVFGAAHDAGRVDVLSAAMFNGTAAHAHDFDDCSNTMGGHPSAPIVPALWALAERRGLGGRALLSAYIAGVEVETRLGRAVNFHHYEKGWHPTATLGVFGAAAAASHLMGLDRVKTAAALALAASMASGLKANFGTMTKPFHVGFCARNGLSAAMLARAGLTSNPAALEHPQGFFKVYDEGQVNADAVLAHWADPLDLIEPGIAFKRHPCCASTHPAIDALLILRERHHLRPENVRAIRSWTHPRRLRHTNRPNPTTGLDAKFSVQYVLSRALIQGRLTLGDFDDTAVADKSVRAVMARVLAEPHPKADMESYEHFFAEVTVTTTDGQELHARVERPLGRDRAHPLPDGALEAKFMDCAVPVVGESSAQALREHLCTLETVASITAISPFLVGTEV